MFILLLIISQASCDWVEISQNHYRKEPPHKINFERTTPSNKIYKNYSTTETQWRSGAVNKVSKVANIRRVQYPTVKTNSLKTRHEANRFSNDFYDRTDDSSIEFSLATRRPNVRQKFNRYNEKDHFVEHQGTENVNHGNNLNSKPLKRLSTADVNIFVRRKQFHDSQNVHANDIHVSNQTNQVQASELPTVHSNRENDYSDRDKSDNIITVTKPNIYTLSSDDKANFDTESDSKINHFNQYFTKEPSIAKIQLIKKEDSDYVRGSNSHQFEERIDSRNRFKNANAEIVTETNSEMPTRNTNIKIEESTIDKESPMADATSNKLNIPKLAKERPLKDMWKLLKVVADTIYKNTHRSFKSKISYLEGLKSTILTSIEDQIDGAWPDDARSAPGRRGRAAQPRGHVEFPSSESTLMTISFLTFAVFLIKLVLQVIHTYKNKTMMVAPTVVAAVGRAAAALRTPS